MSKETFIFMMAMLAAYTMGFLCSTLIFAPSSTSIELSDPLQSKVILIADLPFNNTGAIREIYLEDGTRCLVVEGSSEYDITCEWLSNNVSF